MNKVFLGIILAVCILGMLLVLLNNRLGRKPESRPAPPVAEAPAPPLPRTPEEIEANARAVEIAEAARALAGPEREVIEPAPEAASSKRAPASVDAMPVEPAPVKIEPAPVETKPAPVESRPAQAEAKPAPPEPKPAPAKAEARPAQPKPEQGEAQKPAAVGSRVVSRFVVYARDKGATVRIGGDSKMEYSSMTLADPDRVVVDLPGSWKFPANPGVPKNELVSAVRVGQSDGKTRVVIDLKQKPRKVTLVPYKNGDGVDVRVDR